MLVELGGGDAFADVAGEIDLHPLAEEAGAGKVFQQHGPPFGTVAGLFDEFALGRGEGRFVGVARAGRELDEVLAGGVAILAFQDDVGVGGVGALVDGQHDDGAVMADDVLDVAVAAGLFQRVGKDVEDAAFVGELGGDEPGGAGVLGGLGGGHGLGLLGGDFGGAGRSWSHGFYVIILHRGGE